MLVIKYNGGCGSQFPKADLGSNKGKLGQTNFKIKKIWKPQFLK